MQLSLKQVFDRNFYSTTPEYRDFANAKDRCRKCSIYNEYKHVGQSEGNAENPIFMFIGEALGAEEVKEQRPFIGKAGQLLRGELRKHSKIFNKKTTIISNVLSCRPKDNQFPKEQYGPYKMMKEHPSVMTADQLVNMCADSWVRREIDILKPKIIIPVGSIALNYISRSEGISKSRGTWYFLSDYKCWSMPIFHPSYVLRSDNTIRDIFVKDIEKIAKTWGIINQDPRLSMSEERLNNVVAAEKIANENAIKEKPLPQYLIPQDVKRSEQKVLDMFG